MSDDLFPPINVLNVIKGFEHPSLPHHITPFRFETREGQSHRIRTIRQTHRERVGKGIHYHYVVQTDEGRFFHLVLDTLTLIWHMVQEVDEELFFNE
jgi:hypothetical protein